jgi:prepilin-type N-terminal cleavage/methylation domain-containing protein
MRGFTLAEVLITLGIIGVVAALVMPSLIANYQKQQTVVRLKKAYSIINRAMKRSEVENGDYSGWELPVVNGTAAYVDKYWAPYFIAMKTCKTYQDCGYKTTTPFSHMNGANSILNVVLNNYRSGIVTTDGLLYVIETAYSNTSNPSYNIYIDLNGSKPPNVYGKDFFIFTRTNTGILPYGYDKTETQINSSCSKTGDGSYCAAKIMQDGWEIKDDYPW